MWKTTIAKQSLLHHFTHRYVQSCSTSLPNILHATLFDWSTIIYYDISQVPRTVIIDDLCCGLYPRVKTAWFHGVLSSSIQFPRDNNYNKHFIDLIFSVHTVRKLQHLVFSPSIQFNWRGEKTFHSLQCSTQTHLVRGIYRWIKKITSRMWATSHGKKITIFD